MNAGMFRKEMQKPVDYFWEQVRCLRSGGIQPSLIDTIKVSFYGQDTPLKHLAHTSKVSNGISVKPHDPNLVNTACKALKDAGFNAYVFSKEAVMVSVPPPSGEDKEQMRKRVRELGEEARVAIRQIRKNFKRKIDEKNQHDPGKGGLSINQREGLMKKLQEATDKAVAEVDEIVKDKVESF